MRIFLVFSLLVGVKTTGWSQIHFSRHDSVLVKNMPGDTLKNPWAGGFNSVQFNEVDLNLDGIMDLFVFDRTGNKRSTFINDGTPNQVAYRHDPSYLAYFPQMTDWVLFRDYNCDGKMDFFTYSSGGMAAWKNTSTSSILSFKRDTTLIYSDYQPDSSPNFVNLYISSSDLPAIDDIDGDGDLDVLTFSIIGSYVEYHKNLSMEKYGTCDSLDFQLRNKCWGFFKETLAGNSVILNDTCSFNINNPEKQSGGNKHAGSTLLTLDVNADNAKDLVLSDVSFSNFTLLINQDASPNLDNSSMMSQDSLFPKNQANTVAMDLDIFPAGFYMDVNNDNIKDLIAAPNCYNGCKNSHNVWYYQNAGADNNPDLTLMGKTFLQDGMIEIGEGAHPVFFDYNADGLKDLIVGSYGEYDPSVGPLMYKSSLWLYENVGTVNQPVFQLVDTNYIEIAGMNLDVSNNRPTLGLAPTFGDIDGDGDEDMLLGDYNGYVHLFRNMAGPGNPAAFSLFLIEYLGIDVGQNATPLLYDLNKDTLIDLIIGKQNGTFSYYENKGSVSVPNFVLITDSLGKISTRNKFDFRGNSNPIFIDSSGTTFLYSGSNNGHIYKFGNIDGNLTGKFTRDSTYLNIWEGINSFVAIEDMTNDGMLDMIVGNYCGGVSFYKGDTLTAGVGISEVNTVFDQVNIYPNPTQNSITIDLGTEASPNTTLTLYDLLGKTMHRQRISNRKTVVNMADLAQGIYLVQISNPKGNKVLKVIKE
ncbi:MAG: T9SS type A sorting domain-containing protein [Flavobacteriales bacterium]|nr:T9SS type A sorting domain-containing protein [Flavobacteriales bacterium]